MTNILATWELGRAFGHVAHVAPLARGLARRGIATAFAARDLLTASSLGDRPFARILQAPLHQRSAPHVPTLTYARAIADGGMGDVDAATVLVAAWLQLIDGVRPDALAAEFAPVSLLAAHVAGLPAVRIGTSWACPPASDPLPSLMPWLPDDPAARTAAGADADEVVRAVCRRFGAPPLDGLPDLLAKSPRFLESWPEIDHYGAAPGATYYGAMTGLAATARPEWPAAEGPRIFVYIPASHVGAVPLAAALGALGWPTIWHGPTPPPVLASNIAYTAVPVDTAHVLGQATLFAGRGGHATGCEAIRQACPQLIIPDALENALLGWRLERQGLAKLLGEHPTAPNVQTALEALAADTRIAAAVTAASARYAKYDPVAAEDELADDVATVLGLA